MNCSVRCDFQIVGDIQAGELFKLQLKKGCYILEFLVEDIVICSMDYTMETNDEEPLLRLNIKEQAEKKIREQKFIRNKSAKVNIYFDNDCFIIDSDVNNPIILPKEYVLFYQSADGQYSEDEAGLIPFYTTVIEEKIKNGETNKSEKTLYGSLNKFGKIVINPIYTTPIIFYNDEIAETTRNLTLYYLNHHGEEIHLSYLNTESFAVKRPFDKNCNLFIAQSTEEESLWGIVRFDKKIIVSISNNSIFENTDNFIWALKGNTLFIYDNEGKWIKSIQYVDLGEIKLPSYGKHQDYVFVHKEAVAVRVLGYWGVYDFKGNVIIPHIYKLLDTYRVHSDWVHETGEEFLIGEGYGSSPLMFVKKRGSGYGIININVFDVTNGILDVNNIKEVIPCKYDAIYYNWGEKVEELKDNFFQWDEQKDDGCSWVVHGIGDDLFFVKLQGNLKECDYFEKKMISFNAKDKEEHFVCREFNGYYYTDEAGKKHLRNKYKTQYGDLSFKEFNYTYYVDENEKYHLRKEFNDFSSYDRINIVKASEDICGEISTYEIIEAIRGNYHSIIIEWNELESFFIPWGMAWNIPLETTRCDVYFDYDYIKEIIIESPESIIIKMKKNDSDYCVQGRIALMKNNNPAFIYDNKIVYGFIPIHKNNSENHNSNVTDKYLFFDTETTGLPHNFYAPSTNTKNWPRLVQLSWILSDEKGEKISSGNLIVKPDGFDIPFDATKVHGITTQRALDEGIRMKEAIGQFIKDWKMATYIVGHNVEFDKKIVGAELIRFGVRDIMGAKKSYCTMQSSIDFCKIPGNYGYKYPKLQELYKKLFGTDFDNAHDAMSDVEATEKCFWELRKRKLI